MKAACKDATVVLVHAAFAGASSWNKVIPPLKKLGFGVVAAQIPLTSLSDDVVAVKRVLCRVHEPVILVAHSYAGAVITATSTESNVTALVYIAAMAPDTGETVGGLLHRAEPHPLGPALAPDENGMIWMSAEGFASAVAPDSTADEIALMVATQKPIGLASLGDRSTLGLDVDRSAWIQDSSKKSGRPDRINGRIEDFRHSPGVLNLEDISTDETIFRIVATFQAHGFDGTTLAKLSEATGLIKASLYYRFPGVKEEIAEAVLTAVDRRFAEILAPIDEPGDPRFRLAKVCKSLRQFYADGTRSCLLDTLSLAGSPPSIREHARGTLTFWIEKFSLLATQSGMAKAGANRAAEECILALEGALIVCRVLGSRDAFRRVLGTFPEKLGIVQARITI